MSKLRTRILSYIFCKMKFSEKNKRQLELFVPFFMVLLLVIFIFSIMIKFVYLDKLKQNIQDHFVDRFKDYISQVNRAQLDYLAVSYQQVILSQQTIGQFIQEITSNNVQLADVVTWKGSRLYDNSPDASQKYNFMNFNMFSAKEICQKKQFLSLPNNQISQLFGWYNWNEDQWFQLSLDQIDFLVKTDLAFSVFKAIQANQQYKSVQIIDGYVQNSSDDTIYEGNPKLWLYQSNSFWNQKNYGGPFIYPNNNSCQNQNEYNPPPDYNGFYQINSTNQQCSLKSSTSECNCQYYNQKRFFPLVFRCRPWYESSIQNEYVTLSQAYIDLYSSQQIMTSSFKIVDSSQTKNLDSQKQAPPKAVLGFDLEYSQFNDFLYGSNDYSSGLYSYLVAPKSPIYQNDVQQSQEYAAIIHPNLFSSSKLGQIQDIIELEFQNGNQNEIFQYKSQLGSIFLNNNIRTNGCNLTQSSNQQYQLNIQKDGQNYYTVVKTLQVCYGNLYEQKSIVVGYLVTNLASSYQQKLYSHIDQNLTNMQTYIVIALLLTFFAIIILLYLLMERFLKYNFEEPISIISSVMNKADPQMIYRFHYVVQKDELKISQELKNLISAIIEIISLVEEQVQDSNQNNDNEIIQRNYQRALQTFEVVDHQTGIGLCLNNLGNIRMIKKDYKTAIQYYKQACLLSKIQYEEEIKKDEIKVSKNDYLLKDSIFPQDYVKKKFMRIHASRKYQLGSTILKYLKDQSQFMFVNQLINDMALQEDLQIINDTILKKKNLEQIPIPQNQELQSRKKSTNIKRNNMMGGAASLSQLPNLIMTKEGNPNIIVSNQSQKKQLIGSFQNQFSTPYIVNNVFINNHNNIPYSANNLQNTIIQNNPAQLADLDKEINLQNLNNLVSANQNNSQFNNGNITFQNMNPQIVNQLNFGDELHDKSFMGISQRQSQSNLFNNNYNNGNFISNTNRISNSNHKLQNISLNNNIGSNNLNMNSNSQNIRFNSKRQSSYVRKLHSSGNVMGNDFQQSKGIKNLNKEIHNAAKDAQDEEEKANKLLSESLEKFSLQNYPHFFTESFAEKYKPLILSNIDKSQALFDVYFHSQKMYSTQAIELLNESFTIFNTLGDYCSDSEKKEAHEYYGFSILTLLTITELHILLNQQSTIIEPLLASIKKQIFTKIIPLEALDLNNIISQMNHYNLHQQYVNQQQLVINNNLNTNNSFNVLFNQYPQPSITTMLNIENNINNNRFLTEQNIDMNFFDTNANNNNRLNSQNTFFNVLPQLDQNQQSSDKSKRLTTQSSNSAQQTVQPLQNQQQYQKLIKQQSATLMRNKTFSINGTQTNIPINVPLIQNTTLSNNTQNQTSTHNLYQYQNVSQFNDRYRQPTDINDMTILKQNNPYLINNRSSKFNEIKENTLNSDILLTKYYILKGNIRMLQFKYKKALKSFVKGIKYFFPKLQSLERIQTIMKNAQNGIHKLEESPQTLSIIHEESTRNQQKYFYDPNDILICLENINHIVQEAKISLNENQLNNLLKDIQTLKKQSSETVSLHFFEVFFRDTLD
ncbi:tetratricopeptide repeat protein (macronuclear) [Tetrahymena thermophila SB210]|uniref:Tetratricopeptide repeat protein n=1 Tax=Tetrahymena thermophila (strain SB210) TaxID=312017 RepID=Q22CL5_TETTS|nr:tetratricopeptide repeat protein [Tetrahymena thermophila SB210]EAR83037.2 tetratricopeptide repeat protein [Tetrahymena thermophila SB210]|eukprot:XP_001030700.2 tetratricopeptide repeat protein [Tetrahymena thermophila SB210]